MRHPFQNSRHNEWIALLLLPAWLACGRDDQSIRLGGWVARPVPAANPAPPPPPTPVPPLPSSAPVDPGQPPPREGQTELAVRDLLASKCFTCHQYGQRDPSGWGSILDFSRLLDSELVVPGDLTSSRLWHRVAVRNDMPFNGERLTPEQKGLIQQWILGLPQALPRPRGQAEILDLLIQDQATAGNQSDVRYVSFGEFVDGRRSPEEIAAAGAIFKVILNSVSRRPAIVDPVAVDRERSIWRFRLADLGWSEDEWNRLIAHYPYCLPSASAPHRALYQRLRTEAPVVRGDWFLVTALSPALYHDLLQLGGSLDEIVRRNLGVDINEDIAQGRVSRLAVPDWGLTSMRHRVLERHQTRDGGYLWLTYHLLDGLDVRNYPLGPRDRNNDFAHSFSAMAMEAIWSLPNGLQAYLLADGEGNRVDTARTSVVLDPRRRNGQVENAISCNACHAPTGLSQPKEIVDVRTDVTDRRGYFSPAELAQIRRIYPANADQILAADANRYRATFDGLLVDRPPSSGSEWDAFNTLTGQYESKLGLRQMALELGTGRNAAQIQVQSTLGRSEVYRWSPTEPLIARSEWVCHFRRIAREARGVNLCAGTFTAPDLRAFCDEVDAEVGR
jgi:serine/threonine-protein kinase